MKVALVFYSGTGNTEAMADAIEAQLAGKADVDRIDDPTSFDSVDGYDALALGCPAMGSEELDESVETMMGAIEGSLSGVKVILFGSYGWGDGEWMRNWQERVEAAGAVLAAEPVIAMEAPDDDAVAALQAAADALVG